MPTYAQLQTALENARSRGDNALADQIEQTYLGGAVPSPMTTAMGGGAAIAQGATLGLYDELVGAVAGPEAQESQRRQLKAFRRESPGAALGLEMLGSIPTGLGIGAGLGAAARVPGMVGRMGRTLSAPTLGGQAMLGGLEGAVAGAAGAEEPAGRLTGGVVGAGLGAITGGAGSRLTGPLTRRLAPGREAESMLRKELSAGGIQPRDYPELARRAGEEPQRTLAELGGPVTEMQAITAHSVGGRARQIGEEALEARRALASSRMLETLGQDIGTDEAVVNAAARIGEQARIDASPLYRQAYAAPFAPDDELMALTQGEQRRRLLRTGYNRARQSEGIRTGEELPTWDSLVGEDGAGLESLTLAQWDQIKRGLDDQYRTVVRKDPSLARNIWDYRTQIVSKLDELGPDEYRQARAAWAGPMAQEEALEEGAKIFRSEPEEIANLMQSYSDAEQNAYRVSMAQKIRRKLQSVPPEGGMPRFTAYEQEQMQAAFPSDEQFQDFWRAITSERDMQRFRNLVVGGSQTARIQAGQERQGRLMGLGRAAGELITGQPGEAARTAAGQLMPRRQTMPEGISDPLAKMLFSQGAAIPPVLQRLQAPAITPALLPALTTTEANVLAQMAQRRATGNQ